MSLSLMHKSETLLTKYRIAMSLGGLLENVSVLCKSGIKHLTVTESRGASTNVNTMSMYVVKLK